MKGAVVKLGYIPLVDAAPLIVAHEMGFASEEGISLELTPAPSWSALRDMLSFGHVDAAHMLSPVPVAAALGLGGGGVPLSAISVLSINGNVIGVSRDLANRLRANGHDFGFKDAREAGRALISTAGEGLRVGVPFPFSMHAELVYYWLSSLGLPAPQSIHIRTVPPALMAEAMKADEIDAFCVGEPWGSKAVDMGVGELLLPCNAIWSFAPEKVLAVRDSWANTETQLRDRLIRALWRAGRWLSHPDKQTLMSEMLARPRYLNLAPELLDRALTGQIEISPDGTTRNVARFVEFFDGAASFPWRSQGEWIGRQLAERTGLDRNEAARLGRQVFRSDIHRAALDGTSANLPAASVKVEGDLSGPSQISSSAGNLILPPNAFFDGRVFQPIGD